MTLLSTLAPVQVEGNPCRPPRPARRGDSPSERRALAKQARGWEAEPILDRDELDSYIKANGRWLYCATLEESLVGIEDSGIEPGSDVGRANASAGFWRPRSGRTYLSTLAVCHRRQRAGDLPWGIARVDLTQLDPDQIGADEELAQRAWQVGEPWVEAPPPVSPGASADGTLADWAENTPGFDSSEVSSKSLSAGSISYADAIPPAAVQAADRRGYRRR